MKLFFLFTFLIISIAISSISAQTEDTQSVKYYRQGLNSLLKNDFETAKSLFKKSVREEDNAPAEYELAKIYMADSSHSMWNISRKHIKRAIELDQSNITYRLFYASLSLSLAKKYYGTELVSEDDAKLQYEKILELDSTNATALSGLGQIKANDFLEFHFSRKLAENRDRDSATTMLKSLLGEGVRRIGRVKAQQLYDALNYSSINLDFFAQKDFNDAVSLLIKAIRYDSLNKQTYFILSSIFEDNGMPGKGIPFLQKLTTLYPGSVEAHLNLGLLYYRSRELGSASIEYQKALDLMSVLEREDFTYNSVKILLNPILKDKINGLSKEQLQKDISVYWKSKDPLHLTPYNERLLEHYTRVAYANLRFSVPGKNLSGWETDRGTTVIKYGIPPKRIRYRPEMRWKGTRFVEMLKTDVWVYHNKSFGFVDEFKNGNFQFSRPDSKVGRGGGIAQYWDDSKEFIEDLQATQPDEYVPLFNGPIFRVPYKVIQLNNPERRDLTDLFISYGIKPEKSPGQNVNLNYKHSFGIFFFDSYFNKLAVRDDSVSSISWQNKIEAPDSGNLFVNSVELIAKPDSGNMSFEILRNSDNGVAAYHGHYKIRSFNSKDLILSDIILASDIEIGNKVKGRISRKDYSILLNPTGIFNEDNDLYIYYEIYNLDKDIKGLTDFKQDIVLQEKDDEGILGNILSPVLKFIGIDNNKKQVSLTSNYQTKDKDSQVYLQLDMSDYEPGDYVLTVKIIDNISGKETEQRTELTWK